MSQDNKDLIERIKSELKDNSPPMDSWDKGFNFALRWILGILEEKEKYEPGN